MLDKLPTSRELYEVEMAQRDTLRGAVGQPIALISVLGTLLGTMAQKFDRNTSLVSIIFAILFLFACYAAFRAAVRLAQTYHGHTYKGIPGALEIKQTEESLRAWYRDAGGTNDDAENELRRQLDDEYTLGADHNAKVNRRKLEFLYLTNRYIVFASIATAAAFPLFVYNQSRKPDSAAIQVIDFTQRFYTEYYKNARAKARTADTPSAATTPKTTTASAKRSSRGGSTTAPVGQTK